MADIYEDSYYPVAVAADMTGYSLCTVRHLVQRRIVKSRRVRGRRMVHLGSLLAHRQRVAARKVIVRLVAWLADRPDLLAMTYPQVAYLAEKELRLRVHPSSIHHAWRRLGCSKRS